MRPLANTNFHSRFITRCPVNSIKRENQQRQKNIFRDRSQKRRKKMESGQENTSKNGVQKNEINAKCKIADY